MLIPKIKMWKENGKLVFENCSRDRVIISMKDGSMQYYNDFKGELKDRKNVTSFFRGYTYEDITSDDPKILEYFMWISRQHVSAGNIGTFVKEFKDYQLIENLIKRGFKCTYLPYDEMAIEKFIKEVPNDIKNIIVGNEIRLNTTILSILTDKDVQNALRSLPNDRGFIKKLFNGLYSFKNIIKIVYGHGNPPYRLFMEYIHYIVEYEGLDFTYIRNYLEDYYAMNTKMGAKFERFPKYLVSKHDITCIQYSLYKETFNEELFCNAYINSDVFFSDEDYTVVTPSKTEDLKKEGRELNHCVKSYISRVIDGDCLIYFIRPTNNLEEHLLTVEIVNKDIKQIKGMYNRSPEGKEIKFIKKWAKKKGLNILQTLENKEE